VAREHVQAIVDHLNGKLKKLGATEGK